MVFLIAYHSKVTNRQDLDTFFKYWLETFLNEVLMKSATITAQVIMKEEVGSLRSRSFAVDLI